MTAAGGERELGIDGLTWISEIGSGGFGSVHRARDEAHGRDVAVKLLHASVDERSRRRFDRERKLMGSVSGHPNVVSIHTSGFTAQGVPYIVMELIAGGSLAQRLRQTSTMGPREVRGIGVALGEAMCVAHETGVLHLDIKPDNVLVGSSGEPQLADFGIASSMSEIALRETISISPAFSPPEILNNVDVDARSDVYSLAATLYTCLTGEPPYRQGDEGMLATLARLASDPVPRADAPGMPAVFSDLLMQAMAKESSDRPTTMRAFTDRLMAVNFEPAASGGAQPVSAQADRSAPTVAVAPSALVAPGHESPPKAHDKSRGSRPLVVTAAVAAILLLAAVVFLATRGGPNATVDTPEPTAETPTTTVPATPTETPVETANAAPAETAPAAGVQPERPELTPDPVRNFFWSLDVDDAGEPISPIRTLDPLATQLCASWDQDPFPQGARLRFNWYFEGDQQRTELLVAGGSDLGYQTCLPLPDGVAVEAIEFRLLLPGDVADGENFFNESIVVADFEPGLIEVTVRNNSGAALCRLDVAPPSVVNWGRNDLGRIVPPGGTAPLRIVPGEYHWRALDCDGQEIDRVDDARVPLFGGETIIVG